MHFRTALAIAITVVAACSSVGNSATAPYPASQFITDVTWDFGNVTRTAIDSDLWPMTWADDGNLYTSWGDGGGFGGDNTNGRVKLGIGRVEGAPESFAGFNILGGVNPESSAEPFPGKSHGIISVDGVLYLNVTEQDQWRRSKIGRSEDHGRTWIFNGGSFDDAGWDFAEPGGAFAGGAFLQYGQDYSGSPDNFVYMYGERERQAPDEGDLLLARVPKGQIQNRNAYEFLSGFDNAGAPTWSSDFAQADAVFHDDAGVTWGFQVTYHPATQRYLLTVRRTNDSAGRKGRWGIFDAPEPWGPWTTVAYYDDWQSGHDKQIMYNFPTKWMSGDGRTAWMAYSARDSLNVIRATFTLAGPVDTTPPAAPTNLSVTATTESQIDSIWAPTADAESGVSQYRVYRDGSLVSTVFDTAYSDTGLEEATSYTYEVSAVNGAGTEGPRSLAASTMTLADTTAPFIQSVTARDDSREVVVTFSEAINEGNAQDAGNYSIDNGVIVDSAVLDPDLVTVSLSTSDLQENIPYTLTVNRVHDRASSPNEIAQDSTFQFDFVFGALARDTVPAEYEWSILENGGSVYVDRSFSYTSVPVAYDGLDYLRTANDDKFLSGAGTVAFDVPVPVTVFVAYDVRTDSLPGWLSGWQDTGDELVTSDTTLAIYSMSFAAGRVELGGNEMGNSTYTVVLKAQAGDTDNLPVAAADAVQTETDSAVNIAVLANDSGLLDGPFDVSVGTAPANGTALVESNNTITYTPDGGYEGDDTFTYRVTDADGDESTAQVDVTVNAVVIDSQPSGTNDEAAVAPGNQVNINVLGNDTGLDDDPLSVTVISTPSSGTAVVESNNTITYTAASGFTGDVSFSYRVSDADGDGAVASVAVSVEVVDSTPIAIDDVATTLQDTAVNIAILLNDVGLADAPLVASLQSERAANGTLFMAANNTVLYTPDPGFIGSDNFSYSVTDADGDASEGVVSVVVSSKMNDRPSQAADDDSGGAGAAGPFVFLTLLAGLFRTRRRIKLR